MEITFTYRTDGTAHAHRPGCADTRKRNVRESFTAEVDRDAFAALAHPTDGSEPVRFHGCIVG